MVSWILKSSGTSKKDDTVARETLSFKSKEISSPKMDPLQSSFATFIVELEKEIFPFYEEHEKGFDKSRIHGRMHVARAVVFAKVYGTVLSKQVRNC